MSNSFTEVLAPSPVRLPLFWAECSTGPAITAHEGREWLPSVPWLHGPWQPSQYSMSEIGHGFGIHTVITEDADFLRYEFSRIVVVDYGEPLEAFPEEHRWAVDYLRSNGRPILAGKLEVLLAEMRRDPEEAEVNVFSMWDMARVLTKQKDFADPAIATDWRGFIHAQWRITGNGVLVWGFQGNGEILMVAQADAVLGRDALNISECRAEGEILAEFGHLVPRS